MATLTNEQIEAKKQLLAEKTKELPDDELDQIAGGGRFSGEMDAPAKWLHEKILDPIGSFWNKIFGS